MFCSVTENTSTVVKETDLTLWNKPRGEDDMQHQEGTPSEEATQVDLSHLASQEEEALSEEVEGEALGTRPLGQ